MKYLQFYNFWDKKNPLDFRLIMIEHCSFLNMRSYLRIKLFNFGVDIYTSNKVRTSRR